MIQPPVGHGMPRGTYPYGKGKDFYGDADVFVPTSGQKSLTLTGIIS